MNHVNRSVCTAHAVVYVIVSRPGPGVARERMQYFMRTIIRARLDNRPPRRNSAGGRDEAATRAFIAFSPAARPEMDRTAYFRFYCQRASAL